MMTGFTKVKRQLLRGFSLVEVTLATGIASFGIITLLGLLPSGLSMFRDSMNVTISSQIAQGILKEAGQTDYQTLVDSNPEIRYYNDEGVELELSERYNSVFTALTMFKPQTDFPNGSTPVPNDSLITMQVQVVLNSSGAQLPTVSPSEDGAKGLRLPFDTRLPHHTYNGHVARIK